MPTLSDESNPYLKLVHIQTLKSSRSKNSYYLFVCFKGFDGGMPTLPDESDPYFPIM